MNTRTGAVALIIVVLVALAAVAHAAPKPEIIYADGLNPGWIERGFSWSASVNLSATPGATNSTRCIQVTLQPWGGLALKAKRGLSLSPYVHLVFDARGKSGGERIRLGLYTGRTEYPQTGGLKLEQGLTTTFTTIKIPLKAFGGCTRVDKVTWMALESGETIYLDNIRFEAAAQ